MHKLKGLYILDAAPMDLIYGPDERADVARLIDLVAPPQTCTSIAQNFHLLHDVEVILSGWGSPVLDRAFLDRAPALKGFFYGSGAMGSVLTESVWERGITVTSALAANAKAVAEYTLAVIVFSLKHGWRLMRETSQTRSFPNHHSAAGCYHTTVGLISAGAIARQLMELLASFDMRVIVYDPFLTEGEAKHLGVERVPLDRVFRDADVISLHTPHLAETEGLITGELLETMKQGATFPNSYTLSRFVSYAEVFPQFV